MKERMVKSFVKTLALFFVFGSTVTYAQEGMEVAKTKSGDTVRIQRNQQTGSAHRVFGLNINISRYDAVPQQLRKRAIPSLSKAIFEDFASVLKVDPSSIELVDANTDGKMWFVFHVQSVHDVPVYGTEIGYTINQKGDIIALGADAYPDVKVSTTPSVSQSRALKSAQIAFGEDSTEVKEAGKLIIYPEQDEETAFHLAWKIRLFSSDPLKDVTYFVDAHNSKIIATLSNLRSYKELINAEKDLKVASVPPDIDPPVLGLLEKSLDGSVSGTVTGEYYPENPSDSPQSEDYITTDIGIYDDRGTLLSNPDTDSNGYWSAGYFGTGNYLISIPLKDTRVKLRDGSGDPISFASNFSVVSDVQYDYEWGIGDASNVKYHARRAYDIWSSAPFNYGGMGYQMDASINKGPYINGKANGTDIFFGSAGGQEWALSSDVIYHEYTHNVIDHIYGGSIANGTVESASMDEGLSDYFASVASIGIFGDRF